MRSIGRLLVCLAASGLVFASCTSAEHDRATPAPTAPATESASTLTEPIELVLEGSAERLGSWEVSPDRTAVAFVTDAGEGTELRVAGADGKVATIGRTSSSAYPTFVSETELVVETVTGRTSTLRYATTEDDGFATIVQSTLELVFAGATETEIIFAETSDRATALRAWDRTTEQTRTILEFEHEEGGFGQAKIIDEYIVYELTEGDDRRVRSTFIADGRTFDLPRHPPGMGSRIIGASPIPNTVVLTEQGRSGAFIYTIDLDNPDQPTDLASQTQAAGQNYTGATLQFIDRAGSRRLLDLATGDISEVPPEQNSRADQTVVGLVDDTGRVAGQLANGNWLVTGFSVTGRTYESVWNRSDDFGGGQIVTEATVKALFEYDPDSQQLWQVSGPPTFARSFTVSGSGEGPSWVLRAEAMDGFIVYSTGFRGAAYDIAHNLYIAPYPSSSIN